ncbi:MAG: helix-turn-helix domain-containing protein [Candidatus Liptonbacteria bacterium]|nr:helix-turn-helix domain-containing protein [Candidatus Liptonbacteria bacterium]
MAKFKEKALALKLRREGMSYSQIKSMLKISKSTLSYWLRDYPLSKDRIRELRDCNEVRIERYRETRRKTKEELLKKIYNEEKEKILPLAERDLFIAGLFLYWGEGSKTQDGQISVSNTDPVVIKMTLRWFQKVLLVPKEKIYIKLHLYQDMDISKESLFWSRLLQIPLSQFKNPYIKKSNREGITYKVGYGHGTCNLTVGNANLNKKVMMGLKVIRDYFNMRP